MPDSAMPDETHRLLDEAGDIAGAVCRPRTIRSTTSCSTPASSWPTRRPRWPGSATTTPPPRYGRAGRRRSPSVPAGPRPLAAPSHASARIDLALVLSRVGQPAEAGAQLGTLAVGSGRLVPSNIWRARGAGRVAPRTVRGFG